MTNEEWEQLYRIVDEKKLATLVADALEWTKGCFETPVPEHMIARLNVLTHRYELSANLLQASGIVAQWADLKALGWRQRAIWFAETLFPAGCYMLHKYDTDKRWLLPALYLRRLWTGLWKRLKSTLDLGSD
jgi:hypothetical protein